jgi:hypothetical protein
MVGCHLRYMSGKAVAVEEPLDCGCRFNISSMNGGNIVLKARALPPVLKGWLGVFGFPSIWY